VPGTLIWNASSTGQTSTGSRTWTAGAAGTAGGRLPISEKSVRAIPTDDGAEFTDLVERWSPDADLTIMGFTCERLAEKGSLLLERFAGLKDVLFVAAGEKVAIE
jgi:hypothetical protein